MINLLPEELKEEMYYGRKNRQILNWIATAVFGVIILFVIAAVGRLTIQTARDQTLVQKENMEAQLKIADFDTVSEQYGDYVERLSNVKKLYGKQVLYTRLIRKLGTLLPAGARLTNISLSDQDRAISLNFDNDTDGLGPVILLNLTDQSKQVSDKTRTIFADNLRLPLAGPLDDLQKALITSDTAAKTVSFYVHSPSPLFDERLSSAAKSGGDMAFMIAYDSLDSNNYLLDYSTVAASKKANEGSEVLTSKLLASGIVQPQIRSYIVRSNLKAVDFLVSADSLDEAKQIESSLLGSDNSIFIETYTFEDAKHPNKNRCTDEITNEIVCEPVCEPGSDCFFGNKTCKSITPNGCRYIIRAYYDELYSAMTIEKLSSEQSKSCSQGSPLLSCTHRISSTYSQLFSQVDTNRVSACSFDATTGSSTCPVEMRAEFSPDAKFYLINSGVSK